MSIVTIHAAKTNLSKLLARVEAGEAIVIARGNSNRTSHAHPCAAGQASVRRVKGVLSVGAEFFEPMTNAELAEWE